MLRRILLGTLLGAIAAFAWGYVSWRVIRLYDWAIQPMPGAVELAPELDRAVPRDGAYAFPGIDISAVESLPPAQRDAAIASWRESTQRGPVGVLLLRKEGRDPLAVSRYLTGFGYLAFGALLMSVLMAGMKCPSWVGRWTIGIVIALFAAMVADGPDLAWFQLPARWVYAGIADTFLTWTAAAAVIAAVVRPRREAGAK